MSDPAMLQRPSWCTGRTTRQVGDPTDTGGYRLPHRAKMSRGEFMRPGDVWVNDSGPSEPENDTEAPRC